MPNLERLHVHFNHDPNSVSPFNIEYASVHQMAICMVFQKWIWTVHLKLADFDLFIVMFRGYKVCINNK